MKIDIHTHTKKIKSGDSPKREIAADKFADTIRSANVGILAITNHNHFDLQQYHEFRTSVMDVCQVWPGIEFDVLAEGRRAHLIIIANPKQADAFANNTTQVLSGKSPDTFTITLEEIIKQFDKLDCVYVAHYYAKKPDLSDEDVAFLVKNLSNPKRILKEATNSISAGIYISHGHNSIYGSDVHDWDLYVEQSRDLPELRLPVESFEQFCLLLEKDKETINTLLSKKHKETITLNPFGIAEVFDLDIYNDINILFGSKGTGKSFILQALSEYYNGKGFKTAVYASSDKDIRDVYDVKCAKLQFDLKTAGVEECSDEFTVLRNAVEKEVTPLSRYYQHYLATETNKISKSVKIKALTVEDEKLPRRQLKVVINLLDEVQAFQETVITNAALAEIIGEDLFSSLSGLLEKITAKLKTALEARTIDANAIRLFNHLIRSLGAVISSKTGRPEKPVTTGFSEYADNRIKIEQAINKIVANMAMKITVHDEEIGSLGEKGQLILRTSVVIQNGTFSDKQFSCANKHTKGFQKEVARSLIKIQKHVYSFELFEKIAELLSLESGNDLIGGISDLLLFNRQFLLDGKHYDPSKGESSMILLHAELAEEKEIYLIDEPERSLGNDYINDVIVPMLKQRALMGKKIIIATHDANIAVRTLPYNSIYRAHDEAGYHSYCGNPFSNSLKCIKNQQPDLDWKEISMKTLEGGKNAFGERGKIYGAI